MIVSLRHQRELRLKEPASRLRKVGLPATTAYCTDNATQAQIAEEAYETCEWIIDDLLPLIGSIAMGRTPL